MINKFFKNFSFGKLISVILLIGIGYFIYTNFINKGSTNTTITIKSTVKKGTVANSISAIGTADLINDQKIRFNQNGTIAKIHFKEGDKVKKGQVIVELDKTDLNNSIKQAQVSLNDAKIKLATDLKPAEQKDILSLKSNIAKTENDLITAQDDVISIETQRDNKLVDINNSIESKKVAILQQQTSIDSKKNQLLLDSGALDLLIKQEGKNISNVSIDTQTTIDNGFVASSKYLLDASNSLNTVDSVFGETTGNKAKSESFINYISAKDSNLKYQTDKDWNNSNSLYQKYSSMYSDLKSKGVNSIDLLTLLNGLSDLFNSLNTLGKDSSTAVNASITSSVLSQSDVDSYYNQMYGVSTNAQSNLSNINKNITDIQVATDPALQQQQSNNNIDNKKSVVNDDEIAINNLITGKTTLENDLVSLQNSLDFTKQDYENQLKQQQFTIQSLQNSVELGKANLEYLLRGATKEQIDSDKNNITKAEISLGSAKTQVDKYQIVASFDGTITQLDFKLGDNLSTQDNTEYVYINNPNLIEITAQLDQIDIGKVKLGQEASMVFDSFPNTDFTGMINEIDPTPIITSGVTSYNIKITFDKGKYDVYTGMTAKIQIIVEKKDNVLIVQSSFIQKRIHTSSLILDDGTASGQTVDIVTGLSNAIQTEVVSGVKEGDKIMRIIVIPKTTVVTTGTGTNKTGGSIIPGVGGIGGGGGGRNFGGGGGGGGGGGRTGG